MVNTEVSFSSSFTATLALVFLSWRTPALHPALRQLANLAGGLLILQVVLGVATFRLHLQVEPLTVAHGTIGAALLGSLVVFSVLALRDGCADAKSDRSTSSSVIKVNPDTAPAS